MAESNNSDIKYVGSIDQGTSSSRFILFDRTANVKHVAQQEYKLEYPEPGWAEVPPSLILNSVTDCLVEVMKKLKAAGGKAEEICAVGITNQRETCMIWDDTTGEPLSPAIIWLDTRTKDLVDQVLKTRDGDKDFLRDSCGLPVTTYFSALKWKWMLENIPACQEAVKKRTARFGTVDTWLIYKLTGSYVTDVTNASRTMLMNLSKAEWDVETCKCFGIDSSLLPEIRSNSELLGKFKEGPLKDVSITSSIGDQQAATLGQLCVQPGMVKNTYGTGCFLLMNTGTEMKPSTKGLLTTALYQLGPKAPLHYALEGSVAVGGQGIKWLRDNLGLFEKAAQVEELAASVEDSGGVVFVPAFTGLFAPYWNSNVTATLCGMTLHSRKEHICRAFLEGVCFQSQDVFAAMEEDSGIKLNRLQVDGGMTVNDLMLQIQANISQIEVARPSMTETTALGAALAAGLAVNFWESLESAVESIQKGITFATFKPTVSKEEQEKLLQRWQRGIQSCLAFES